MTNDAIVSSKELLDILKITAPGTNLREGLDNVLRAKTGGLIVLSDSEEVMNLLAGGFQLDCVYSPAHLYELAKMDGAIILNKDATRIICANAHLNPDQDIPSEETGIRHRTAEKTARQTNELVIAISQRRNVITLYKGDLKYFLKDSSVILSKANQAVQTLEKYKNVLDSVLISLGVMEYDGSVTIADVAKVLQRAEMLVRVEDELTKYICELGSEGRLIKMQVEELVSNVANEELRTIMDYQNWGEDKDAKEIRTRLHNMSSETLLNLDRIAQEMGFEGVSDKGGESAFLTTRGYRLLGKVPRLPAQVINNLVKHFGNFNAIVQASIEELDDVEGIGAIRAKNIRDGLRRLREQLYSDTHWQ